MRLNGGNNQKEFLPKLRYPRGKSAHISKFAKLYERGRRI